MNSFVEFIVKDLLGQASILIAFIAMLGLILQKKSPGKTAEGTFKTLLGFLIMMAGINIIVATLTFLNDIFTQGFGMKGYITDVAAIAGLANRELGSEVALTLMVIFAVNIIIALIGSRCHSKPQLWCEIVHHLLVCVGRAMVCLVQNYAIKVIRCIFSQMLITI